MRTKILSLAGAAVVGLATLTGLQASAQASEYRHGEVRFEQIHRDRHHFNFFYFDQHRDHDRRHR